MPAIPRSSAPWASCPRARRPWSRPWTISQALQPADPDNLAFVTQTTLSVDDTQDMVEALKARFPAIVGPHKEDICYATTNRQGAVKRVAPHGRCDDRGGLAQFLQFAAPARGRRAGGLPAGAADPARRGHRLDACSATSAASASPPAPPRPRSWSRRSSTPSPSATRSRSRACRRRMRACSFLCRASCVSRRRSKRWRSIRKSATRSSRRSSTPTTSARCCPTRASPRAWRTPTTFSTPRRAPTSSPSTRSG